MMERLTEAALTALMRNGRRGDIDVMRTLLASIGNDIANDGTIEEVREFSQERAGRASLSRPSNMINITA